MSENFLLKPGNSPAGDEQVVSLARPASFVTAKTLSELDLDMELLHQYTEARYIFELVKSDLGIPINQKSQLIITISRVLSQIVQTQQALHNVETMKLMETILIDVLKRHEAIQEDFLRDYEYALRQHLAGKKKEAA